MFKLKLSSEQDLPTIPLSTSIYKLFKTFVGSYKKL